MEFYLNVWKKAIVFDGRARRKELWMFFLVNIIVGAIIGAFDPTEKGIIGMIYDLAIILPSVAVWIRRMHDVGKSGWFCLIPFYNLYLGATEGDKGPNAYGPDPKG